MRKVNMPSAGKKKWVRPMLTVLTRGEPSQERVLLSCKLDLPAGTSTTAASGCITFIPAPPWTCISKCDLVAVS